MSVQNSMIGLLYSPGMKLKSKNNKENTSIQRPTTQSNSTNQKSLYNIPFTSVYNQGLINKTKLNAIIPFKGYWGDPNPAKKLNYILSGGNNVYEDDFTNQHIFRGQGRGSWKRWVIAHPAELLRRTPHEAINSLCTLTKPESGLPHIPNDIKTPNYGDNWGRRANYIEINPRPLGTVKNNRTSEGILGAIKILPAIPASQSGIANCVILSELYPTIFGDGWINGDKSESSQYTIKLNEGICKDLTSDWLQRGNCKISPDEQIKSFNDLAHLRGLKTGIRMPLSADQIRVNDGPFNWNHDGNQNDFINACTHAIDLGFDAIYFDSAKHVGGYDMGNYHGCGSVPDYGKMQYINAQIRQRSGRNDISLIGEMCDNDVNRYQGMGLTAGTGGPSAHVETVKNSAKEQDGCHDYAAGVTVSNDNDCGNYSYGERLARLDAGLFGSNGSDKLPVFMEMHDLFPLNWQTNTHDLFLHSKSFSAFGDPESHWNNLFAGDDVANNYRREVNNKFAWATAQ